MTLSVSGSLLALLLFLVKPLLKNRIPKAFLYYAWLIVLLRLCIPFAVPEVNLMGTLLTDGRLQAQAAKPQIADTTPKPQFETDGIADMADTSAVKPTMAALPQAAPLVSTEKTAAIDWLNLIKNNLFWLWLTGAAASFGWFCLAYAVFTYKLKRSLQPPNEADEAVFDAIRINRRVKLMTSSIVATPMLIGVFRPKIVVPQMAYARNGMTGALRYILRHELVHSRRKDILLKWVCVVVTSAHWFNPLMFFVRKEFGKACELACDEAVIQSMSHNEMQAYGNTLLALSASKRIPSGVLATTLCEGKKELKERLTSIMKYKRKTVWTTVLSAVLAVLLAGCGAALGTAVEEKENSSAVSPGETVSSDANKNEDIIEHKMLLKGESDAWTGELIVDYTEIFHVEDGILCFDYEDNSELTVAYKGDLTKLDDSTSLRIEGFSASMEQTGVPSDNVFKLSADGGSFIRQNTNTFDVKITLNGEEQTVSLKVVENSEKRGENCGSHQIKEFFPIQIGDKESWESSFYITSVTTYAMHDGKLSKDNKKDYDLSVNYIGDVSELASVKNLAISLESAAAKGNIDETYSDENPLNQQSFSLKGSLDSSVTEDNIGPITVTISADGETIKLVSTDIQAIDTGFADVQNSFGSRGESEKWSGESQSTDTSYQSDNINVSVQKYQENDVTYYVADIYIADMKYLKSAFSGGAYNGTTEDQLDIAKKNNAVVSITGDYYMVSPGVVLRNGELFRTGEYEDVCVLNIDGTMQTFTHDEFDLEQAKANAWQIWSFGPMLLKDGKEMEEFNSAVAPKNPRAAIGYYEPGHYCFVVVDGRQSGYSVGMTLQELSKLFESLGCKTAYNLDGGQSATMTFCGTLTNKPYNGGRATSDIVYIGEEQ